MSLAPIVLKKPEHSKVGAVPLAEKGASHAQPEAFQDDPSTEDQPAAHARVWFTPLAPGPLALDVGG
jgi:hypothetical protein